MILSIRGFPEGLHKKLKVAAVMEGVTIESIVTEAMEKRLSGVSMPVIESPSVPIVDEPVASVPVVEHTSSIGQSKEVRPIHAKKVKESEWAQGMCPKHGRMAINGKFTCC